MATLPPLQDLSLYPECDTEFSEKVIKVQKEIRKEKKESFLSRFTTLRSFSWTSDFLLSKKVKHEHILGH